MKFLSKYKDIHWMKYFWKCCLQNVCIIVYGTMRSRKSCDFDILSVLLLRSTREMILCFDVTTSKCHSYFSLQLSGLPELTEIGYTKCFIKSPRYTRGDFMFLYRFVRRRRRRPQIVVHAITFEQLFGFLSFSARLLALTCRLPD